MKLKSLIENSQRLEIAEVEIEFIPGIPQIHFLGLPDRIIKESFYRIKSALKSCGYKFPLTSQMIVNIKPNHLRKSSRGVELAVALGILMKTEQIPAELIKSEWILYGELGLDGRVYEPSDLNRSLSFLRDEKVLTGTVSVVHDFIDADLLRMESLNNFDISMSLKSRHWLRPEQGFEIKYSEDEAEFLFLSSVTGMHALLAGDSGAGKSTLARALSSFLPEPSVDDLIRREKQWRPFVSPHQSITPAAFLGGGAQVFEGEIERAQGGVLLLDELLEFDPEILEALRGPMTGDKLRISRAARAREIETQFQVVATTNLCPCGKWSPLKKNVSCRFSRLRCTRYLERLSGPLLDRFGLMFFTDNTKKRKIDGREILKRIEAYTKKQKEFVATGATVPSMPSLMLSYYSGYSIRRKKYLEKAAQVYALEAMEGSNFAEVLVEAQHLEKAEGWTLKPFELLEKGM